MTVFIDPFAGVFHHYRPSMTLAQPARFSLFRRRQLRLFGGVSFTSSPWRLAVLLTVVLQGYFPRSICFMTVILLVAVAILFPILEAPMFQLAVDSAVMLGSLR